MVSLWQDPRKPAALKSGKSESKEHLDNRALVEDKIRGGGDLIYDYVPDNLTEIGKNYYRFIINELNVSNLLSNLDIPMLTQMCTALSTMDELQDNILENGHLVQKTDRAGNVFWIENPAENLYIKYQGLFMKIATQFGLSPSARSQLAEMNMTKQEDEDNPALAAIAKYKKTTG